MLGMAVPTGASHAGIKARVPSSDNDAAWPSPDASVWELGRGKLAGPTAKPLAYTSCSHCEVLIFMPLVSATRSHRFGGGTSGVAEGLGLMGVLDAVAVCEEEAPVDLVGVAEALGEPEAQEGGITARVRVNSVAFQSPPCVSPSHTIKWFSEASSRARVTFMM